MGHLANSFTNINFLRLYAYCKQLNVHRWLTSICLFAFNPMSVHIVIDIVVYEYLYGIESDNSYRKKNKSDYGINSVNEFFQTNFKKKST